MRRLLFLLPLPFLLACPGDDGSSDGKDSSPEEGDADGDGYSAPEDCDDDDPAVNPAAAEVCDAADVDEDCDGLADEADTGLVDGQEAYADGDGDGYGDASTTAWVCEVGAGFVLDDTDCDDEDAAINPGATEVCDDADTDEDCDGLADNADDSTSDATAWYADADEDGYGSDGDVVYACDAETGIASVGGDCDDADPSVGAIRTWYDDEDGDGYGTGTGTASCTEIAGSAPAEGDCDDTDEAINPGASEVCDEIDNDCDEREDDADDSLDLASAPTWYADADGDGHGDADSTVQNCEQPSGYRADGDDCDDADATTNPGASEVCDDGADNDCDGDWVECRLGDLTLGASTADAMFTGEDAGDEAGTAVAFAGDIDADGTDDLLITALAGDGTTADEGAVYLVYGGSSGSEDLGAADARYTGTATYGLYAAVAGDLDGDGEGDILVGSPWGQPAISMVTGTTTSSWATSPPPRRPTRGPPGWSTGR